MTKIIPNVIFSCNHPAIRLKNSELNTENILKIANKHKIDILNVIDDSSYQTIILSAIKDTENLVKIDKPKDKKDVMISDLNKINDWVCFCSIESLPKNMKNRLANFVEDISKKSEKLFFVNNWPTDYLPWIEIEKGKESDYFLKNYSGKKLSSEMEELFKNVDKGKMPKVTEFEQNRTFMRNWIIPFSILIALIVSFKSWILGLAIMFLLIIFYHIISRR